MHFSDSVRRVKWLKQMVFFPDQHRQVTAALFGSLRMGGNEVAHMFDHNGQLISGQPGAAFPALFQRALEYYRGISGCEAFF